MKEALLSRHLGITPPRITSETHLSTASETIIPETGMNDNQEKGLAQRYQVKHSPYRLCAREAYSLRLPPLVFIWPVGRKSACPMRDNPCQGKRKAHPHTHPTASKKRPYDIFYFSKAAS